jgi:tRNA threonylcarbamoyladenosine biosynthesis protein TsaB
MSNIGKQIPILAVDTSNDICSVAVVFDKNKYILNNLFIKNIHSEKLFEIIESSLKLLNMGIKYVKSLVYSNGPGSFTGLRIGMSALKGIATGLNVNLYVLNTYDVMAYELSYKLPIDNIIGIVNQADNEEYYYASYRILGQGKFEVITQTTTIKKLEFKLEDNVLYFGKIKDKLPIYNHYFSPNANYLGFYLIDNFENCGPADLANVEPFYLKGFKGLGKKR